MKAMPAFVVAALLLAFQPGCTLILTPDAHPARDGGSDAADDGETPPDGDGDVDGDADGDADGDVDGDGDADGDGDGDCVPTGEEVVGNCIDEDCDDVIVGDPGTELDLGTYVPTVGQDVLVRVQSEECFSCIGLICELQGGPDIEEHFGWRTDRPGSPCIWTTDISFSTEGTWQCTFCENCDPGPECVAASRNDLVCAEVAVRPTAAE